MDRKIGLSIYSSLDNLWVEAEGMQFIYHKFENYCSVYAGKVFTSLGIALCFAIIGLIPGLYKGHFEYVSICILFILFVSFCLSEVDASPKPNPKRKWSEIELKTLILPCVDLLLILLYLMVSTTMTLYLVVVSSLALGLWIIAIGLSGVAQRESDNLDTLCSEFVDCSKLSNEKLLELTNLALNIGMLEKAESLSCVSLERFIQEEAGTL